MGSVENKNKQEFDRWVSQCLIKLANIVLVVGVASSDLYIYYLEVRA